MGKDCARGPPLQKVQEYGGPYTPGLGNKRLRDIIVRQAYKTLTKTMPGKAINVHIKGPVLHRGGTASAEGLKSVLALPNPMTLRGDSISLYLKGIRTPDDGAVYQSCSRERPMVVFVRHPTALASNEDISAERCMIKSRGIGSRDECTGACLYHSGYARHN